jgi:hypothetical protein
MQYEAPQVTEVGTVEGLTLGDKLNLSWQDSIYVWGHEIPIPFGSR